MKRLRISGYSESLEAQKEGVRYYINGVGSVILRRGGLSDWQSALSEATECVLGENFSINYIDPDQNQRINAKACADYLVASLCDDFKDSDDNVVTDSRSNRKAIFENEENYSLVLELIQASMQSEYFLIERVKDEVEQLKKS